MNVPSSRYGRVRAAFAFIRYLANDGRREQHIASIVAVVFCIIGVALLLLAIFAMCSAASAAPATPTPSPTTASASKTQGVPVHAVRYRLQLQREVSARFGVGGNVALIAGQIHAESAWRPNAESKYAQGLSQFTPATATWLPEVCPDVGRPDPWDPGWSMRAIVCYDAWLYARNRGATECDRWAFTFSDYNGGGKWRAREQALAANAGFNRLRWFAHVELFRARKPEAWQENRAYVRRILHVLAPHYIAAGWPGRRLCL